MRTLEARAQDDVLDLFDIVVTALFTDAAKVGKKARLQTIRDLDAAAFQLRRVGGVLMDDTVENVAVREAAFVIVPRAMLAAALEQIDAIVRPPGDLYFTKLRAQTGKLRFIPALLRSVALGATPAGYPALDAMNHLRSTDGRGPAPSAPLDFVPSGWKRQLKASDGGVVNRTYADMAAHSAPWSCQPDRRAARQSQSRGRGAESPSAGYPAGCGTQPSTA